jgi:hypothetical protein
MVQKQDISRRQGSPKEHREIEIIKADSSRIIIRVQRVHVIFYPAEKGRIKTGPKSIPDSQIFDSENIWIPKAMFSEACQMAAKAFADRFAALKKRSQLN